MNLETRPRFLATRPELPSMEAWAPILGEAYAANWFTNFGGLSLRFEDVLVTRWGFDESACIAASSGTVALAAPLIARNVAGPVLTPAFTFPATASAIKMAGARPALVDVDPVTWRVTAAELDAAFRRTRARAAIVVCPFGLKTDWSAHIEVAKSHGAILVIDNAAGLGVIRDNVEQFADVFEVFSLHATKPFGIGEGGAIFAHRENADLLRSALNFGLPWRSGKPTTSWGLNGKLSELHAAVGLAVETTFESRITRRRSFAGRYMDALRVIDGIGLPSDVKGSTWQVFPVLMRDENAAQTAVTEARTRGMELRRYYRPSLSQQPSFEGALCPTSESLADRMICLPVYSLHTETEEDEMLAIAIESIRG